MLYGFQYDDSIYSNPLTKQSDMPCDIAHQTLNLCQKHTKIEEYERQKAKLLQYYSIKML